ncbi:imidazole glycerol phosphate synthase subunit HisH [Paenibacillus sp. FSL R7-0337]|uniref:imidazole glycerol phosphate synthase subunit HisH n=1 Tax=Paenibacillus sp. FSL R7-0337 TaxID=1926588 RepID=UPI00096CAA1F|nr:imidazole glycerol phosphate synthase subunit HisH [Paenibacillus sp. FSL R7-0337]OMF98239.1 imidazole glycerol phosphate synthase subunit HisH [Paenibacillus sp. FSL R7-0337]
MAVAIVDYGMGNLHSVSKAVERLGYTSLVTSEAAEILAADSVILPGVGAFGDAMEHLRESGMDDVVRAAASAGQPVLGICLGMQLLFSSSEEHGEHKGLELLPGAVVRFAPRDGYKVPHMGWNKLSFRQPESPLLAGLTEGHVYFVHSYHVLAADSDLLAVTDYGHPVTAIVARGNVYGMQFHPEKSGELGIKLLGNFLQLRAQQA